VAYPKLKRVKTLGRGPAAPPGAEVCLRQGVSRAWLPTSGKYSVCLSPTQQARLFPEGPPVVIGCGAFACAYDGPTAKTVVKLTTDVSDIASLQQGQSYDVIPEMIDVYELQPARTRWLGRPKGATGYAPPTVYAVEVERLAPLAARWKKPLACLVATGFDSKAWGHFQRGDLTAPETCCTNKKGVGDNACREALEVFRDNIETVQSDTGLVPTNDLHIKNVGVADDGTWKILDLGFSAGVDNVYKYPMRLEGARARATRSKLGMPVSPKKKVALSLGLASLAGLAAFFIARKARADDFAIDKLRKDADVSAGAARAAAASVDAANARAAAASGAAADAQRRQIAAEALATNAGSAAAAAIAAAEAAAAQATGLATAAREETNATRRRGLEREAALQAQHAKQLQVRAAQAQQVQQTATTAAAAQATTVQAATEAVTQAVAQREEAKAAVQSNVVAANEATTKANTATASMEMKRQLVAGAFQETLARVKAAEPGLSRQAAINKAAAVLKAAGIVLDAPNPAVAFWQMPDDAFREKVTTAVNSYTPPAPKAKPAPKSKSAPKVKAPSVRTIVPADKLALARNAWEAAIAYAIARAASDQKQTLTRQAAFNIIAQPFIKGSSAFPGAPTVPVYTELSSPVPFWAQSTDTIRKLMGWALTAAKREVDSKLMVLALDARNAYTTVPINALARNAKGQPLLRKDPKSGKLLPIVASGKALSGTFSMWR